MNKFVNKFFEHLDDLAAENLDKSFKKAFISVVQKVIDEHAPIKQISRKLQKLKSKSGSLKVYIAPFVQKIVCINLITSFVMKPENMNIRYMQIN